MSGVAAEIEFDMRRASEKLGTMLSPGEVEEIAFAIGELVVNQVKERIATGKQSPEGIPWAPWSARYAATREARHSLLVDNGNPGLLESIGNYVSGNEIRVGTNLIYAATHQFGSEDGDIPARPYLGLSQPNRVEIEDLVVDLIEEGLR